MGHDFHWLSLPFNLLAGSVSDCYQSIGEITAEACQGQASVLIGSADRHSRRLQRIDLGQRWRPHF